MKSITSQDIEHWFDRLYAKKGIKSMRNYRAYPVLLDHLQVESGKRLLDIGSGPGLLLKAAAERGLQTYGVDISEEAKKLANRVSPDSHVSVADVRKLSFDDESFDYITCVGVLEHFLDLDAAIREMQRVAKKDAVFCIMVPNSKTVYWKMAERFSRNHRESNENANSLREWRHLFESYNFDILAVYRDDWQIRKPFSMLGLTSFEWLFKMTRNLIWTLIPLKYAHQFVFLMQKSSSV